MKSKVCFILPYFGKLPYWFRYFRLGVEANPCYDWLFVTDFEMVDLPPNATHQFMNLEGFNTLAATKLKLETNIRHPYKICDFKPAFGHIFEDYLKGYLYWGYCDMDIVFGDMGYFIAPNINAQNDVISPDDQFFPGHFCLFRNVPAINKIYQQAHNVIQVYTSSECYYFDEFGVKTGMDISKGENIQYVKALKARKKAFLGIKQVIPLNYLRFLKRFKRTDMGKRAFNGLLFKLSEEGKINVSMSKANLSDFSLECKGIKHWNIHWQQNKLYYNGKRILYFHFQLSKNKEQLKFISTSEKGFVLKY